MGRLDDDGGDDDDDEKRRFDDGPLWKGNLVVYMLVYYVYKSNLDDVYIYDSD